MRLERFSILICSIFLISASFLSGHTIISPEDRNLEQRDFDNGPALSSVPGSKYSWESDNQWACFQMEGSEFTCTEITYGKRKKLIPTLRVEDETGFRDYDLPPELSYDCGKILEKWSALSVNYRTFCAYGAEMKDVDTNGQFSLWYLDRIKFGDQYWVLQW